MPQNPFSMLFNPNMPFFSTPNATTTNSQPFQGLSGIPENGLRNFSATSQPAQQFLASLLFSRAVQAQQQQRFQEHLEQQKQQQTKVETDSSKMNLILTKMFHELPAQILIEGTPPLSSPSTINMPTSQLMRNLLEKGVSQHQNPLKNESSASSSTSSDIQNSPTNNQ